MSLIYHFNRPRPHYAQSVHVIASIVRSYGIRPEHTHVTNATYTVAIVQAHVKYSGQLEPVILIVFKLEHAVQMQSQCMIYNRLG